MKKINLKDIRAVLEAGLEAEINAPVLITEHPDAYPIKENPWENWLPFAYVAFREVTREVRSFAAIGTGSGVDAIGACYAFPHLETVILTDINNETVAAAEQNVRSHFCEKRIRPFAGSLCTPLVERGITVDLIYENLPNIADTERADGSHYLEESVNVADDLAKAYLLASHVALLESARSALTSSGIVLCSIGGRMPSEIMQQCLGRPGYHTRELVAGFKVQTEPEEVLPGYARAERRDIQFDFYRYDAAMAFLRDKGMKVPYVLGEAETLRALLEPFQISATEAAQRYEHNPREKVGHLVVMVEARKK